MSVLTIVDAYIRAIISHAFVERPEPEVVVVTAPPARGVVASGANLDECMLDFYSRLEDWVQVSLARGDRLPAIDGIDLNGEASRVLATRQAGSNGKDAVPARKIYETIEEFEAAMDSWVKDE